jgi:hypothetical protein
MKSYVLQENLKEKSKLKVIRRNQRKIVTLMEPIQRRCWPRCVPQESQQGDELEYDARSKGGDF